MKKTFKGFIACLMAALLVVPAFTGAFAEITPPASVDAAAITAQMKNPDRILEAKLITSRIDVSGIRNGRTFKAAEAEAKKSLKPTDIVTIMVKLEGDPAVKVCKNLNGLSANAYRDRLYATQDEAIRALSSKLDSFIMPTHKYSVLFNGFSFEGEYGLVKKINAVHGFHAFAAPEWGVPELFNTVSQVHAVEAWDLKYTGENQLIAIIDTGCKTDHPAFGADPENPAYTKEQIAEILPKTHAGDTPVDKVYRSGKIPFGWNYEGENDDISHKSSDHGTHVSGIAAGNGGEIKGVAPDAQLAIMQVFSPQGGASFDVILLALEDTAVLGASAANLSLGHICGEEDYGDPVMEEILDNVVAAGVNLSMSAGNEGSAVDQNRWGGYALVENPDYGLVGGPSTGAHGISVAAVQNTKQKMLYIQPVDGEPQGYIENDENAVKLAEAFGGQTLEYVMIPGAGAPEDYEGLDVNGKAVFVQRGATTFIEKGYAAQAAGAAVCVIYNNVPGEPLRMVPFGTLDGDNHLVPDGNEGRIPHVSMTLEAGEAFAQNEDKHLFISAEAGIFDAPDGNQVCAFSSWGVPSTMGFKPEISAPGGNIYSSTDKDISGTDYAAWDGTSMAAPHITGGMAILRQLVNEKFPELTPEQQHNLVNSILMSTADPLRDAGGCYASPRHQGAGQMNLLKAVTTNAYITVEGAQGNRPKVNLGDDPECTGEYGLIFTVHNFGDKELKYAVQPSVLLDEIAMYDQLPDGTPVIVYIGYSWDIYNDDDCVVGDIDGDGAVTSADALMIMRYVMDPEDAVIEDPIIADIDQDGEATIADAMLAVRIALGLMKGPESIYVKFDGKEITVPAGGETEVTLPFSLTGEAKDYIDAYYDSGAFIEGFMELIPIENAEEPSLTLPFMGFYGDWNYPRTVGDGYYYEDIPLYSNSYPNIVGYKKGGDVQCLGINPFIGTDDMTYYLEDRNAISPNGDRTLDTVSLMYMDLERNSYVRYVVLDSEGNELGLIPPDDIGTGDIGVCTKGYFDVASGTRDQLGVNYAFFPANFDFTQFEKEDLIIRIEAKLNNDGRNTVEPFTPEANECWKWDIPVHIDTEAPEVTDFAAAEGKFTFKVTDGHYAAYAAVYTNAEGALGELVDEIGIFEDERGKTSEITLDGGANDYVLVGDYAGNVSAYLWDGEELAPIGVEEFEGEADFQDAELFTYSNLTDPSLWVHFPTTDMENLDFAEDLFHASGLFAAGAAYDFVNNKVYVATAELPYSPMLYMFDFNPETLKLSNPQPIGEIADAMLINAMAYIPQLELLIGIDRAGTFCLIDPATAECRVLGGFGFGMVAMDFDPSTFMIYLVDDLGELCVTNLIRFLAEIDQELFCQVIAETCITPILPNGSFIFVQGGCLVGNTFYWHSAVPAGEGLHTQLVRIDIESGAVEDMGFILQDGFATSGMFGLPILPEPPAPEEP